jgi:phosphatidylglycerophosphatase A
VISRINKWVAAGFGSGYAPVASGTFGTLAAIPLAWCWAQTSKSVWAVGVGLSIAAAVFMCDSAAGASKDPGWIVLDEIVGFWVAVLWLPPTLTGWSAAFFLFRLFDILKPFPANWFDGSVGGGLGIVMDDVVAGAYTRLCLWGLAALGVL